MVEAAVAGLAVLACEAARAQEALQVLKANLTAEEARRARQELAAYTVKIDDLRLLASTSLELDWNDDINGTRYNPLSDFILRASGQILASYPVSQSSFLNVNFAAGYDDYLRHSQYSYWLIGSGSEVALDIDAGQLTFDLHDRMAYTQDSALEGAVAGTGFYGYFQNDAGISGNWDLNQVNLALGYDHVNLVASSPAFDYLTHASEDFFARAGLRMHPRLVVGSEATVALTGYERQVLNDNTAYSAGLFGDWRPSSAIRIVPRAGYTAYLFDQTSRTVPPIKAVDEDAWYVDLTASHQLTDALGLSLSAGRQLRLGVESDSVDAWYVRPGLNWALARDWALAGAGFYEHGHQVLSVLAGPLRGAWPRITTSTAPTAVSPGRPLGT